MHSSMEHTHACHEPEAEDAPLRIGKRLKIVGAIYLAVLLLSFLPQLEALNQSMLSMLKLMWWAVGLGLLSGGLIDVFVPQALIHRYLGGGRASSLVYAVFAGFLLSACSHGILAISIELYKKGASIPAVVTFLLASPWANLPVTFLLFGFFGVQALLFVVTAMLIALLTGIIFTLLEEGGLIEQSLPVETSVQAEWSVIKQLDLRQALRGVLRGAVNLANMVLWWILIGLLAAAFIGAYVPGHIFIEYFGPTLSGLFLTLLFATVIEVCSEGSAPIAFEVFNKVGSLGNPFVFLMAGVVTDYTEIGLLWTNIGKRTAIMLPVVTVPMVLLAGYLFNLFL